MIKRIDELTAPVEPGKFYIVPTVTGTWRGMVRAWPVIGPRHNDAQCLRFEPQHYHLDGRFLSGDPWDDWFWRGVGAKPLMLDAEGKKEALPAPEWRKRKCRHAISPSVEAVYGLSVPLVDHAVEDGVVTCPLHLLRIDAVSGRVLPPKERVAA